jgi:hypothetical protein
LLSCGVERAGGLRRSVRGGYGETGLEVGFDSRNRLGWPTPPFSCTEQRTFTDGRIIRLGDRIRRKMTKPREGSARVVVEGGPRGG